MNDPYSGANFEKKESGDGLGAVSGEYRVLLPDGRTQIVSYRDDGNSGFVADVSYEGEAAYPQQQYAPGYVNKAAPYDAFPQVVAPLAKYPPPQPALGYAPRSPTIRPYTNKI